MRIKPNYRRHRSAGRSQAGTALMEFLFALPFLFFILILSLNFCKVFLMKQRAIAAVRYVAFAEVRGQKDVPKDDQVSKLFFPGEQAQVLPTQESGVPLDARVPANGSEDSGQTTQDTLRTTAQNVDNGFGLSGFLNKLSGSRRYEVKHSFRPVFAAGNYWGKGKGNWFPDLTVSSSLTIDSKDWRHDQMSFGQLLKNALKEFSGPLSNIF
jgi:hypothetical protein